MASNQLAHATGQNRDEPAVLVPLWPAVKKLITAPRADRLELSPAQHVRMKKTRWRLTILGLVAFLLGIFVLWLTVSGDMPAWLRSQPDLLFGSIFVVGLGVVAAVGNIARYYVYAALALAVFIGGSLLNADLPLAMILAGSVVLLAGFGLLGRKGWGRILALVVGFLNLLNFPIGTAIGAYTFFVLLQESANTYFE